MMASFLYCIITLGMRKQCYSEVESKP